MFRSSWSRLLFAVAGSLFLCASIAIAYLTDTNVYLPSNYYTFVPPAAGGSYLDPVFGTSISRISDAVNTIRADTGGLLPWVEAEYSTKSPSNFRHGSSSGRNLYGDGAQSREP